MDFRATPSLARRRTPTITSRCGIDQLLQHRHLPTRKVQPSRLRTSLPHHQLYLRPSCLLLLLCCHQNHQSQTQNRPSPWFSLLCLQLHLHCCSRSRLARLKRNYPSSLHSESGYLDIGEHDGGNRMQFHLGGSRRIYEPVMFLGSLEGKIFQFI